MHERKAREDIPIVVPLDFYPLTVMPSYGIIAGVDSQILTEKSGGFSLFKLKVSVSFQDEID